MDYQRLVHDYVMKSETLETILREEEHMTDLNTQQNSQPGLERANYSLMTFSAPPANLTYSHLHVPYPHYTTLKVIHQQVIMPKVWQVLVRLCPFLRHC